MKNVQPGNGKFRSFLLKSLKNFCVNTHAKAGKARRKGSIYSLDEINREEEQFFQASDSRTPEQIFDRRWAESLMQQAIDRLEEEYLEGGKGDLYSELKEIQNGERDGCTYAKVGERLGLSEERGGADASHARILWKDSSRTLTSDSGE